MEMTLHRQYTRRYQKTQLWILGTNQCTSGNWRPGNFFPSGYIVTLPKTLRFLTRAILALELSVQNTSILDRADLGVFDIAV